MNVDSLRRMLADHSQHHILEHWHRLTDEQKCELYEDASAIDLEEVAKSFQSSASQMSGGKNSVDDKISPPPSEVCGSVSTTDVDTLNAYWDRGLREIGEGNVAVLLLAGGQGTRLGVDYPKGQYDVGILSGKTLFQLQAERIIKLQTMAKDACKKSGLITWYIMTSGSTKPSTVEYFSSNEYFGLSPNQVVFFEQGTLPCLSFDGKILMESAHKIARAPDGNGGLYSALKQRDILTDMEHRGLTVVHVYCVDNILVRPADPTFIGFCLEKDAECAAKVCEKTEPSEPVGVVCCVDNLYQVVEYSEISQRTSELRDPSGRLTYRAGNIANHFFTVHFLRRVCFDEEKNLKYHVAKKKIPVVDGELRTVKPDAANGIKMEKFVFDVFQFAESFAVWEVGRQAEFSPLKNAEGGDSPSTCREMLYREHARWVDAAGGTLLSTDGTDTVLECEVSPSVSYAGENLVDLCKGKTFKCPLLIGGPGESSKMSTV